MVQGSTVAMGLVVGVVVVPPCVLGVAVVVGCGLVLGAPLSMLMCFWLLLALHSLPMWLGPAWGSIVLVATCLAMPSALGVLV